MRRPIREAVPFGVAGFVLLALCLIDFSFAPGGETKGKSDTLPRQVLIIRHGEKPTEGAKSVHLSDEGQQRAESLRDLFVASKTRKEPFPTPDFIFATKDSSASHRPIETVTPLSKKLKLPINTDFRNEDHEAALAREISSNSKYAGKTVLICWHHGMMPELAKELKATGVPDSWKPTAFDRVWELSYGDGGKVTLRDRPAGIDGRGWGEVEPRQQA